MIRYEVDAEEAIKLIERRLGALKNKAPSVLNKAINRTAKEARKSLANKAQQSYTVKTVRFNKDMKIKNSTARTLTATIKTSGRPMALSNFKVNPSKPTKATKSAAKAKVVKANKLKALMISGGESNGKDLKAFVTKFASGHVAVVQRVPGTRMKNKKKEQIKEFYSPSIPSMIGSEKNVYGPLRSQIRKSLKDNIDSEIAKVLGG